MIYWQQRMIKKIPPKKIILACIGKVLFWFGLGSLLSERAANYQLPLLFLGTASFLYYLMSNLLDWQAGKEIAYLSHFSGMLGGLFLVFSLGIQFPHMNSAWIFPLGVALTLPALGEIIPKKRI